jgi:hypothetical protein
MEECLIKNTKKLRVRGDAPSRKELYCFKKLGEITDQEKEFLLAIAKNNAQNDLGTDTYDISKHCNYVAVFNANHNYRQILLQTKSLDADHSIMNEFDYDKFLIDNFLDNLPTIKTLFNQVYRFRLSIMQGNHELNWHIDTDPSVICRAQICLKNTSSSFEFETKKAKECLNMHENEIYFINTGWKHRVVNESNDERIVAIFGFHFDDLQNNTILKLTNS